MHDREKYAYRINDVRAALRYVSGVAEHTRTWVHVVTGPKMMLHCAWRRTDVGYELTVSREDRAPDAGDLSLVRRGLEVARWVEVGTPVTIAARRMVSLRFAPAG